MRGRILGAIAAGVVGLLVPGCGVGAFTCHSDAQCVGREAGVCQPDGHCSFPADDCPSGQRYGEHSGPSSGMCVTGEGGDTQDTGGGSTFGSGSPGEASGPVVDTGAPLTTGDVSSEPLTSGTGPTTTSDATSEGELTTGDPVDPDLVLWLELERAPPGEVPDSSSYLGHGACVMTQCPQAAAGVVGQAVLFDGADDVIAVPHAPWLETLDAFTLSLWLRLVEPPAGHQALLVKPLGAGNANTWELFFWGQSLELGMVVAGSYQGVSAAWPFEPGQWVHLAGTWDGGALTLWLDGTAVGSVAVAGIEFDDHPLLVGADDDHHASGLVGHLLGRIDDVRVYRRALSAEEIDALAGG
jgi:hypothetical protein